MALEIFTICGMSVLVGLSWINGRVQEIAVNGDVSRLPTWMLSIWRLISETSQDFPQAKKARRPWRWFLLALYLLVIVVFVPRAAERLSLYWMLVLANGLCLAIWIYYVEKQLKK
jgi:hypothetical protein